MEKWSGKTAFVAGGNSGMGAALVRRFLDCNMKVYSMDKKVDFLNDLKSDEEYGRNLTVLQADATKEEDVLRCVKYLAENTDEINVVVHSIGNIGNNSLIDGEFAEWQSLLNVNIIAFCSYMKEVVNLMLKQNVKDGRIIVLNSIVALETVVFGELHFYAAMKCATDALVQGLRYELQEKNSSITISNIYAGLVKTDLYKNSLGPNFETPFFKTFVTLSVDDITETVEYILRSPPNVLVSKMVVCPRGVFKANYFAGQQ